MPEKRRVIVAIERRFDIYHGHAYSTSLTSDFWDRYLQAFDEVYILARAREVDCTEGMHLSTGPNVHLIPVPYYKGPMQYILRRSAIKKAICQAIDQADHYILRVPGMMGSLLQGCLKKRQLPYVAEVVGDPWESLKGLLPWPLGLGLRWSGRRRLSNICKQAAGCLYVTEYALQRRYPAGDGVQSAACSSVVLPDEFCLTSDELLLRQDRLREPTEGRRPFRLGFIGTFETMYKAPDVHLRAIKRCRDSGLDVKFDLVGEGQYLHKMKKLADELGLTEHCHFRGRLRGGKEIFDFLDQMDMFLIASLTEGLPRALIEALARGCPSIGSRVGGIPDLLPEKCLVPPGDANALAEAIERLLVNIDALCTQAKEGVDVAQRYRQSILVPRRTHFYKTIFRK